MNLNTNWLLDKGKDSDTLVLFAHGAGADMHSDFMADYAALLTASGPSVLRFNFPYMVKRGEDGKRRPPDRAPALLQSFEQTLAAAVAEFAPKRLFLMGKSMGGRMAAMLAANDKLAMPPCGVICLGYPFLPPKKTEPRLEPCGSVPRLCLFCRASATASASASSWPPGRCPSRPKYALLPTEIIVLCRASRPERILRLTCRMP